MELELRFESSEFERLARLCASSPELFAKARTAALRRTGINLRKNVARDMRAASYLKGRNLTSAIGKVRILDGGAEASLTIAGSKKAAHLFRLAPNKITARKGVHPRSWQSPMVNIGPGERPRHPESAGFSQPFIAQTKKGRRYLMREKMSGNLIAPKIASPQYFAAFNRVKGPVMAEAEATFLKRLEHEIDYRLGLR